MSMSADELAARLESECDEAILALVVATLEDHGSFEEESHDWGIPTGYGDVVRVADAAARRRRRWTSRGGDHTSAR